MIFVTPYWTCECGHKEPRKPGERVIGERTIFQVEPCPMCKRPMMMVADGD